MQTLDMNDIDLRAVNATLQGATGNDTEFEVLNLRGSHAVAVGLDAPIDVTLHGSAGYYCAGMNKQAKITVKGSVGPGPPKT